VLRADDVRAAHRELSAKGVRFAREPFDLPRGTFATLLDPWGNVFGLTDSPDF
jgi:predicted enzyme related to lactoylglutathione lyase